MKARKINIRCAILLPLAALAVWYFLVPAQIGLAWLNLHNLANHSTDGSAHLPYVNVPRNRILSFAIISVGMSEGDTVTALDMPGTMVELLISLPTTWPESWHPAALPPKTWRALALPFFCLPVWWFVGRGLDSLLGWIRLRWWTLLVGTLLSAFFLVLFLAGAVGEAPGERGENAWLLWGLALWTLAFAVFPATWIHRWFTKRKLRAATIKISV